MLWNNDLQTHTVGLRVVLDTYLGKQDGAPFRIPGVGDITTETVLLGKRIPSFWYSFDDLKNPSVRAQGTLKGSGLTTPDRVVYAGWGRFDKFPWNFLATAGKDFKQSVFSKSDSAVGIYWEPKRLESGDTVEFKTAYGLYGSTIYKGKVFTLSLGGAVKSFGEPFLVSADIQNVSPFMAKNVNVKIIMSKSLTIARGNSVVNLGDFPSDKIKRVSWLLQPKKRTKGKKRYLVKVTGYVQNVKYTVKAIRAVEVERKAEEILKEEKEKEKVVESIKSEEKGLKVKKVKEGVSIEFGDVYFKFQSSSLLPKAKQKLDRIGLVLKKYKNYKVVIKGHTDNIGTREYNLKLSRARARNVWKYLIDKGYITPDRAVYKGYGELHPIASNKTKAGRQKNRRVEIVIVTTEED